MSTSTVLIEDRHSVKRDGALALKLHDILPTSPSMEWLVIVVSRALHARGYFAQHEATLEELKSKPHHGSHQPGVEVLVTVGDIADVISCDELQGVLADLTPESVREFMNGRRIRYPCRDDEPLYALSLLARVFKELGLRFLVRNASGIDPRDVIQSKLDRWRLFADDWTTHKHKPGSWMWDLIRQHGAEDVRPAAPPTPSTPEVRPPEPKLRNPIPAAALVLAPEREDAPPPPKPEPPVASREWSNPIPEAALVLPPQPDAPPPQPEPLAPIELPPSLPIRTVADWSGIGGEVLKLTEMLFVLPARLFPDLEQRLRSLRKSVRLDTGPCRIGDVLSLRSVDGLPEADQHLLGIILNRLNLRSRVGFDWSPYTNTTLAGWTDEHEAVFADRAKLMLQAWDDSNVHQETEPTARLRVWREACQLAATPTTPQSDPAPGAETTKPLAPEGGDPSMAKKSQGIPLRQWLDTIVAETIFVRLGAEGITTDEDLRNTTLNKLRQIFPNKDLQHIIRTAVANKGWAWVDMLPDKAAYDISKGLPDATTPTPGPAAKEIAKPATAGGTPAKRGLKPARVAAPMAATPSVPAPTDLDTPLNEDWFIELINTAAVLADKHQIHTPRQFLSQTWGEITGRGIKEKTLEKIKAIVASKGWHWPEENEPAVYIATGQSVTGPEYATATTPTSTPEATPSDSELLLDEPLSKTWFKRHPRIAEALATRHDSPTARKLLENPLSELLEIPELDGLGGELVRLANAAGYHWPDLDEPAEKMKSATTPTTRSPGRPRTVPAATDPDPKDKPAAAAKVTGPKVDGRAKDLMQKKISALQLSAGTESILIEAGITTIGELTAKTSIELVALLVPHSHLEQRISTLNNKMREHKLACADGKPLVVPEIQEQPVETAPTGAPDTDPKPDEPPTPVESAGGPPEAPEPKSLPEPPAVIPPQLPSAITPTPTPPSSPTVLDHLEKAIRDMVAEVVLTFSGNGTKVDIQTGSIGGVITHDGQRIQVKIKVRKL
jgi:hypothetical protein